MSLSLKYRNDRKYRNSNVIARRFLRQYNCHHYRHKCHVKVIFASAFFIVVDSLTIIIVVYRRLSSFIVVNRHGIDIAIAVDAIYSLLNVNAVVVVW